MAIRAAGGFATLLGLASPASAEDCRLALVLALDVSRSVSESEDRLQREGLAYALLAPEVVRAFLQDDPVALFVFEWASTEYQVDIIPGWQMVRTEEDLARVAAAIIPSREREKFGGNAGATAVGTAMLYAAEVLSSGPDCEARTVDVSGDGERNDGPSLRVLYERPLFDGVTVNALVIGGDFEMAEEGLQERLLVAWFERRVLRGPGAFAILADGYEDFERAMRIKLMRELQMPMVSGWPMAGPKG